MANLAAKLRLPGLKQTQWQVMAGPALIMAILAMMILPLPSFVLDMLFTFNIVLSLMILMVAMFTQNTLEFSAFPTVLLFSTLLRLALNVASTRIILMHGHTGEGAAGKVIDAFGHFLVGGNFAIGIVVFTILIIINFMVITKGAGRIAEVGARFVLDGMPGKQMAIDADLNAGLIGEEEAKRRRSEVTQEADFYGSMDGASKFVRGDAIAGILIMVINVIGGLIIGILQHDLSFAEAGQTYTLLTIGDGLVAQIPALIISTAAGVIVTRVSTDQDVGEQMTGQLFKNPQVMLLAAGVVGLLGMIPGMPNFVFLLFTAGLLALAWWTRGRQMKAPADAALDKKAMQMAEEKASQVAEASWADVQHEDVLGLEVGYRLIPMVDSEQSGQLLTRIRGIRKKFAQEMGFLPPAVHIRDNLDLAPTEYRILLKGVEIGRSEAQPDRWLAIDPGCAEGELAGEKTQDPAFGLPAVWIDEVLRERAQTLGYTVVDPSSVVATHLNHLIASHTDELFGRQETRMLLERLTKEMPKLVEDLIPETISLNVFHQVLQNLLAERISIRDMRTIIDTLAENIGTQSDPEALTALVRIRLGRAITQQWFPGSGDIEAIGLDLNLERLLIQATQSGSAIEPGIADAILQQTEEAIMQQSAAGAPLVLLVNQPLRFMLSRFLRRVYPQLAVLANQEIASNRVVRFTYTIGAKS
ncbi:flagellar biosynthesis protein FlhA [Pluralibacter gergoviae]|uniref:Flagellar biosynthesis protein FlhA n=1 Tax=Pluralibacter gergoviae TaxID=61647 RepID=A0AAI9GMX3_PLUGE|nr:flagellar biosynthesis protein FlhA [Pluralibacter gergoviae]AIQ99739.1 flagellar biosynthesis protein FlhA [Pluralibacter gergoviae]AVR02543.1 flagellar biosynthesis protein FlhA [Pluralibacter gergoviae]EKT9640866.1 flagellar biosynthesis protein FlhA [Pluralibacter gergoviae]EKV0916175.1 flagellar biosynthesis protein FlhA [Pluralibacter gergoviae]EKV0931929.1 flagellar biosynthesis protein FlhA [Pluralibacter gergoviae]